MHKNNQIMKKVTIAKGDGIGPEIMEAVKDNQKIECSN